jgi:hypothetical protein
MTDLHTRLLAKIAHQEALRAVIDLHKPSPRTSDDGRVIAVLCHGCDYADHPQDYADWPCSTIRSIAEALGVTEEPTADQELIEEDRRG